MGVSFQDMIKSMKNKRKLNDHVTSVSTALSETGFFPFIGPDENTIGVLLRKETNSVSEVTGRSRVLEIYARACFMAARLGEEGGTTLYCDEEKDLGEFFSALQSEGWRLDVAQIKTEEWRSGFESKEKDA